MQKSTAYRGHFLTSAERQATFKSLKLLLHVLPLYNISVCRLQWNAQNTLDVARTVACSIIGSRLDYGAVILCSLVHPSQI